MQFAATLSPTSVNFTGKNGKNYVIALSHANNLKIRDVLKVLMKAKNEGDTKKVDELWSELETLADVSAFVVSKSNGKVEIKDGVLYYDGQVIRSTLTDRILWGLREGYDMASYVKLLENLMQNPSKRAVDELYGFLEACTMGITEDGHLIAYKKVRNDYRDIYSGKFDNSPGQILEMPRNQVDDDKDRTCSYGFHFCSQGYLPHFGAGHGNRIVIVKVNPRDVVSIPSDYANQKARTCRYEVIGEYTGADKEDILSNKAVWTNSDVNRNFTPDFDFDDNFAEDFDDSYEDRDHDYDHDDNHTEEATCKHCGQELYEDIDDMDNFVCEDCFGTEYAEKIRKNDVEVNSPPVGNPTQSFAEDIPDEISDEHQFHEIPSAVKVDIDEVAVTRTRDGKVKSEFSFQDGLSEYGVVVEIGSDGVAQARVVEKPVPPTKLD